MHYIKHLGNMLNIPDDVYAIINNGMNLNNVTYVNIKAILKQNRLQKYYELIPHIMLKLNGMPILPSFDKITCNVEQRIKYPLKKMVTPKDMTSQVTPLIRDLTTIIVLYIPEDTIINFITGCKTFYEIANQQYIGKIMKKRNTESQLIKMFNDIQKPFNIATDRKNFLQYNYVIYQFLQILDLNEYQIYFPQLKHIERKKYNDKIWKNICHQLDWEFFSTI
jgi:hypothetical protein